MRLIDADALKERFQSLAYDDWNQGVCTSWADAYRECADMVDDMPTIEPEHRWIPVSERLPEYGKSVLCYFKEDEDFCVNHVIDEEDGEWFIDGVTAWMPLPEPYREEGGE